MRLLIVKTSSLGDLVHALPAVTDARRIVPGLRCDWLVERVIVCDMRGWRRHPGRTVFEITSSALGAQSTVCGGGRYDGLVKALGGHDTPAVGFGLGIERFLMMLEAMHGEVTPPRSGVQAIAIGVQARAKLVPLANDLRRHTAMPVFMDFEDRKLQAQFKVADRNNARFALILGGDELVAGEIVLRNLETREDRRLQLGSAAELATALDEAGR